MAVLPTVDLMTTPGDATIVDLLEEQRELQLKFGVNFNTMTMDERIQFIKDMMLALADEIHEALGEVSWKPWQTGRQYVNYDAYNGELIDAFHFLMNLVLAGNLTGEDVVRMYREKREINARRQRDGYDGQNKCPICTRALDDPKTECAIVTHHGRPMAYCVELVS